MGIQKLIDFSTCALSCLITLIFIQVSDGRTDCITKNHGLGSCVERKNCASNVLKADLSSELESNCFKYGINSICCPHSGARLSIKRRSLKYYEDKPLKLKDDIRKRVVKKRDVQSDLSTDSFPLKPPHCGRTIYDESLAERIVGGDEVKPGEFPWIVSLGSKTEKNNFFNLCGGALITHMWVVTAAHCYFDSNNISSEHPIRWVRLGSVEIVNSNDFIERDVELFIPYENYNEKEITGDIALVKLKTPVAFNDNVRPICLPTPKMKNYTFSNETPIVAGWGTLAYSELSTPEHLLNIQIDVIDNEECGEIFKRHKIKIKKTHLCAGKLKGGKDACQGDSGGPLVLYIPKYDASFIIGIVSFGYKCAVKGYPGVYTNVALAMDWIISTVKKHSNGTDF